MSYTERFTEVHGLLGGIHPASHTTEQNTGWISLSKFQRVVVLIDVGALATNATLDVDIEEATNSSGGGSQTLTGKSITQLTQAGGDGNDYVAIEIRGEELSDGYGYIQVEATPATAAAIFGVIVLGMEPSHAPVDVSAWEEIVD